MPVRTFDGVDDFITLGLGSLGFAFGPGSIVMWVKRGAGASGTDKLLKVGTSAVSGQYGVDFSATQPLLRCGTTTVGATGITLESADGWGLVAVTKATGTVTPRLHLYNAGTWTHEDGTGTLANSGVPGTSARIGADQTPANFFAGDVGALAVYTTVLDDTAVEALAVDLQAWIDASPAALWVLDQPSLPDALQDDIGTADESAITGTTVTADDIPWTGLVFSLGPVPETGTVLPLAYTKTRVLGPVSETGTVLPLAFTHDAPPSGAQRIQSGDGVRQATVDSILAA